MKTTQIKYKATVETAKKINTLARKDDEVAAVLRELTGDHGIINPDSGVITTKQIMKEPLVAAICSAVEALDDKQMAGRLDSKVIAFYEGLPEEKVSAEDAEADKETDDGGKKNRLERAKAAMDEKKEKNSKRGGGKARKGFSRYTEDNNPFVTEEPTLMVKIMRSIAENPGINLGDLVEKTGASAVYARWMLKECLAFWFTLQEADMIKPEHSIANPFIKTFADAEKPKEEDSSMVESDIIDDSEVDAEEENTETEE